ncbi:MAG: ankyrin repeat domain-containing protein [Verrucomicrobiota bacterium]
MKKIRLNTLFAGLLAGGLLSPGALPVRPAEAAPAPPAKIGHPSFLSPHASPITLNDHRVFVVNTPSDTVDVIDAKSRRVIARIDVGIDPVSIAVRPDGKEAWVANHVSDSVSVIDTDVKSLTYLRVIATVQDIDLKTRATRFDEPVGIAFASNEKAYVALSSENQVAVVNVASRKVEKRLTITAQDPRAILVRNDRLYVLPFESNNKTQLSGGYKIDNKLVTFNAHEHSIANNNVLSKGHVLDIIKHPRVPDHDLYVFDTRTDKLVEVVDTLGTLLYGLAVDSRGQAFIAQADARNDVNGLSGTKKHGLAELENRAFLNQVTRVAFKGNDAEKPVFMDLEPLPPRHPSPANALATPFAIAISEDDATLVVSAAGSDKIFTMDAASGKLLGQVQVDAVPRGIALESSGDGKPARAWVLNAVANTVSLVDVSNPARLQVRARIPLGDPTHAAFKRGRIAFNKAAASSTATFSCASCHPDGHTDQLLWVLNTPIVTGGNQIMPRSTMPVRGLRDTAPFHWDGIPGDPYGGNNSANIHRQVKPNSDVKVPESTTRHLIDAGLASTMAREGDTRKNNEGKAGLLTRAERDDMAKFLLNVTYPPAQRRAYSNVLSDRARKGFDLFHIQGDNDPSKAKPNVCGDCHRMPFWVSTNTPGSGMEAPTWRGAYDRFLILPQGRLNIIDFDFYRRIAERGIPERKMWQFSWGGRSRFDPIWDMVLEGSTGFSGAFARQLTLNKATVKDPLTSDLLDALESASAEGAIVLQGEGAFIEDVHTMPVKFQFDAAYKGGSYVETTGRRRSVTREKLLALASEGRFIGTFTGRHGANADFDHPQPALWTLGAIQAQRGHQKFPVLSGESKTMTVSGRHIREGAHVIVDGRRVPARIRLEKSERVAVELQTLPPGGMHFLQVQNPNGLFSNDFIFHVSTGGGKAGATPAGTGSGRLSEALAEAVAGGNLSETRRLVAAGASLSERQEESGMPPLCTAAFHGHLDIARVLLDKGAEVSHPNRDGNTALHIAAFLCRTEMVKLLLEKGAPPGQRNKRSESSIDVVSSPWSDELAGFYTAISTGGGLGLDLDEIERLRPRTARLLRDHAARSK